MDITSVTLGETELKIAAFAFENNVIALANNKGKLWLIRIEPENETLIEPFTTY